MSISFQDSTAAKQQRAAALSVHFWCQETAHPPGKAYAEMGKVTSRPQVEGNPQSQGTAKARQTGGSLAYCRIRIRKDQGAQRA
jgi:hypothetical protein